MLSSNEIITTLKSRIPELKERYFVEQIGIFGSYAKGQQSEASDIDFVVRFSVDCIDLFETKYALRGYLTSLFGREVDLANIEFLKPFFYKEIKHIIQYAI